MRGCLSGDGIGAQLMHFIQSEGSYDPTQVITRPIRSWDVTLALSGPDAGMAVNLIIINLKNKPHKAVIKCWFYTASVVEHGITCLQPKQGPCPCL